MLPVVDLYKSNGFKASRQPCWYTSYETEETVLCCWTSPYNIYTKDKKNNVDFSLFYEEK